MANETFTATQANVLAIDNDLGGPDGVIDPGDVVTTTVTITNNSTNPTPVAATCVEFMEILDGMTIVDQPGDDINVSPIALDETYQTFGNTLLEVGTARERAARRSRDEPRHRQRARQRRRVLQRRRPVHHLADKQRRLHAGFECGHRQWRAEWRGRALDADDPEQANARRTLPAHWLHATSGGSIVIAMPLGRNVALRGSYVTRV